MPFGIATLLARSGCFAGTTRSVRQQFASEYAYHDTHVSQRGGGHCVAQGCGRTVEYACRTRTHHQLKPFGLRPSWREETLCTRRVLQVLVTLDARADSARRAMCSFGSPLVVSMRLRDMHVAQRSRRLQVA